MSDVAAAAAAAVAAAAEAAAAAAVLVVAEAMVQRQVVADTSVAHCDYGGSSHYTSHGQDIVHTAILAQLVLALSLLY